MSEKLEHLFVLDFEATCVEGYFNTHKMEIIEVPVVVINIETNKIVGEFHEYVRPTKRPILTEFCINLTGIQQAQVDAARTLLPVLKDMVAFLQNYPNSCYLTDGRWDLSEMLPIQLAREPVYLRKNSKFHKCIDIRYEFNTKYNKKSNPKKLITIRRMLEQLGMTFEGRLHSGIDDARNIARIAQRMIKDNHRFIL